MMLLGGLLGGLLGELGGLLGILGRQELDGAAGWCCLDIEPVAPSVGQGYFVLLDGAAWGCCVMRLLGGLLGGLQPSRPPLCGCCLMVLLGGLLDAAL